MISGNLWHDAETAVLMREPGIRRICTRDTDFVRFPWVAIVDPLAAEPRDRSWALSCERPDSNRDGLPRQLLRLVRLPISPRPQTTPIS